MNDREFKQFRAATLFKSLFFGVVFVVSVLLAAAPGAVIYGTIDKILGLFVGSVMGWFYLETLFKWVSWYLFRLLMKLEVFL